MNRPLTEFDNQYVDVVTRVLTSGKNPQRNERTDSWVKETGPIMFSQRGVPLLTLRDIKPRWACVEAVWFLAGRGDIQWLNEFGFKAWDSFADESGMVESATGWQWREAQEVDQLERVLDLLRSDPSSRRAVLSSWDTDLIWNRRNSNVPCLPTWQFCVVNQKLNLTIFQRSCDLWFGLPADILGAGLILEMVSSNLGMTSGTVTIAVANAHLYEDQWEPALEILRRSKDRQSMAAGRVPNPRVRVKPELLVDAMEGQKYVVHELFLIVDEWYSKWADGPIQGPKMKVGKTQ